jgi:hypothetical protein
MDNTDPPALLNSLLKHMLNDTEKKSTLMMNANLNVEPKCLRESRKFQIRLHLNNPTVSKKAGVNSNLFRTT